MIKKITFNFSSDFETMFTKDSPSEILNLYFEKITVYLTAIFRFNSPLFYTRKDAMTSLTHQLLKFRLGSVSKTKF